MHLLGERNDLLKEPLFEGNDLNNYRDFLKKQEDQWIIEGIRRQTKSGKPLGDEDFLKSLSDKLGHELVFKPKGRPRIRAD